MLHRARVAAQSTWLWVAVGGAVLLVPLLAYTGYQVYAMRRRRAGYRQLGATNDGAAEGGRGLQQPPYATGRASGPASLTDGAVSVNVQQDGGYQ